MDTRPIVCKWNLSLWDNCPLCVGGGVFLRHPSPHYASFQENQGKLLTATAISVTGDYTWYFSSTSFQRRTTRPRMRQSTNIIWMRQAVFFLDQVCHVPFSINRYHWTEKLRKNSACLVRGKTRTNKNIKKLHS